MKSEPRFYLAHTEVSNFFIYCCPDDSAVRTRMMYSSSKNSVIDALEKSGVKCEKKIEIRDASDLSDEFAG